MDARVQVLLHLGRVPLDRDHLRLARLDVGEDEPASDRASLATGDREEVPLELTGEAVHARRAGEPGKLLGEMDRLHLVDDDGAVGVLEAAVEPSFQDRGEPVDGERVTHGLLDDVPGNRRERLGEDATVDGLADPAPLHRTPPAVSDAPRGRGEERARREGDGLRGEIEPNRHAAFYGRGRLQSAWWLSPGAGGP